MADPRSRNKGEARQSLAREMLLSVLVGPAPSLSIGRLNSPQHDRPLMQYVVVEITPSEAESR